MKRTINGFFNSQAHACAFVVFKCVFSAGTKPWVECKVASISALNSKQASLWIKPWSNARIILTQHIATLLGTTCCTRLAILVQHVACCWLKFEMVKKLSHHFECCMMSYSFGQIPVALLRRSTSSICYFKALLQLIATGWPNVCNMKCMLKCCVRLASFFTTLNVSDSTMLR